MPKNCDYVERTLPNLLRQFDALSDDVKRQMPDSKARDHILVELQGLKYYIGHSYRCAHRLICEADNG